jgi:hypothetical protein
VIPAATTKTDNWGFTEHLTSELEEFLHSRFRRISIAPQQSGFKFLIYGILEQVRKALPAIHL